MKNLMCGMIMLALLLSGIVLAESGATSDVDMFDIAINELRQMDSRESVAEAREYFEGITSNYNQAKSFALYTTALLNIYDRAYDEAEAQIAVLKMNKEFAGQLKENGLQSCDVLQTYICAKQSDDAGDITKALQMYSDCMGFMDSQERSVALIVKAYNDALEKYNNGQYEEAAKVFALLGDYKDSQELAEQTKALIPTPTPVPTSTPTPSPSPTLTPTPTPSPSPTPTPTPTPSLSTVPTPSSKPTQIIEHADVGNIVTFGHYEQDNNTDNGTEPIEWRVLTNNGKYATLISVKALVCMPYHNIVSSVTWDLSTLHAWLNGSFRIAAFTEEERAQMESVAVTLGNNQDYTVSLLNVNEVNSYFSSDEDRICYLTDYAKAQSVSMSADGAWRWWLRSGNTWFCEADVVDSFGSIHFNGSPTDSIHGAVRPVIVLNLMESSFIELKMGDSGENVLLLNQKLIEMGYLSEFMDGFDFYNLLTKEAVKKVQHDLGYEKTGVVDEELWNKLCEAPPPMRLKMGDSGEDVLLLNQKLIEMGYLSEFMDGFDFYNLLTKEAVKKAQHDLGYEGTGIVDEELWNKLCGTHFISSTEQQTGEISDTWEEIIIHIDDGTAQQYYAIGATKELNLGKFGSVHMQLAGFELDKRADGSGKAGTTWIAKELLLEEHCMNNKTTNIGGWRESLLRRWLRDDVLPAFPDSIQSHIVMVKKEQWRVDTQKAETTEDLLWIPDRVEIYGKESKYSGIFQNKSDLQKSCDGSICSWWLRSAHSTGSFYTVNVDGGNLDSFANNLGGVAICFCL